MTKKILLLGVTSAIVRHIAMRFAEQGYTLYLACRDVIEGERITHDLQIRYPQATLFFSRYDAEEVENHACFFNQVIRTMQTLDGLVYGIGHMGTSPQKVLMVNLNSAITILEIAADYFAQQAQGFIIGISSVAGDRGRQSNYIYGAAKGGLSLYLQGLRNRLYEKNVRVITIKPGFVDTAMTFGLPGLFWVASPQKVGKIIADSIQHKADIVYVPWFWRYIMLIIKAIPEFLFKRLKL